MKPLETQDIAGMVSHETGRNGVSVEIPDGPNTIPSGLPIPPPDGADAVSRNGGGECIEGSGDGGGGVGWPDVTGSGGSPSDSPDDAGEGSGSGAGGVAGGDFQAPDNGAGTGRAGLTARIFAGLVGVTVPTVHDWVAKGLPSWYGPPTMIDKAAGLEWVRRNIDQSGRTRKGGKQPGSGRPPTVRIERKMPESAPPPTAETPKSEPARATAQAPVFVPGGQFAIDFVPVPKTVEEVDALADNGTLTVQGLGLAETAAKVRALLRKEAVEAGKLLPAEDVREAWTAGLSRIRTALEQLAARLGSRMMEIGLPASSQHAARAIVDEETERALIEMIAGYRERVYEQSGGDSGGDRGAGTNPAAPPDGFAVG